MSTPALTHTDFPASKAGAGGLPASNRGNPDSVGQHPGYNDEDADIVLISSDNTAFNVHSYQLQAASSVFRGMITGQPPSRQTIELTDPEFETSVIVEHILDIRYNYKDTTALAIRTVLRIISFADKYDMPLVIKHIGAYLRLALQQYCEESPELVPVLLIPAWHVKDRGLLKQILAALASQEPLRAYNANSLGERICKELARENIASLSDGKLLARRLCDPADLPYTVYVALPSSLVWIMLQATRVATQTPMGIFSPMFYNKEAGRLLDLAFPEAENN